MKSLICLGIFWICSSCAFVKEDAQFWNKIGQDTLKSRLSVKKNCNVAKNVILFLGDGMGLPSVTATRIYKGQLQGNRGEETILAYDKFPDVGLVKTYNTNYMVADSASTASAMLTGVKTKFGMVGVDDTVERGKCSTLTPAGKTTSILTVAKAEGKSVGIVTTARITHASPSACYAHIPERDWESNKQVPEDARDKCKDIGMQLIENAADFDVLFGGGRQYFLTENDVDPEYPDKKGARSDKNLVEEWKKIQKSKNLKYNYVFDKAGFDKIDTASVDRVLGLFEYSHMQYEANREKDKNGEPSIAEMTTKAIEILNKNPKGYVLFVEGARIDHGHHDSLAKHAITDSVALEKAVAETVKVVDEQDTLVLVTADHSHTFNIGGYPSRGSPLFGLNDYEKDKEGLPFTILMYHNGPGYAISKTTGKRKDLTKVDTAALDYRQESAIDIVEETHGGEDVAIYARGPMSHLFNGVIEQNYISHAARYAACIGSNKGHCESDTSHLCYSNGSPNVSPTSMALLIMGVLVGSRLFFL